MLGIELRPSDSCIHQVRNSLYSNRLTWERLVAYWVPGIFLPDWYTIRNLPLVDYIRVCHDQNPYLCYSKQTSNAKLLWFCLQKPQNMQQQACFYLTLTNIIDTVWQHQMYYGFGRYDLYWSIIIGGKLLGYKS